MRRNPENKGATTDSVGYGTTRKSEIRVNMPAEADDDYVRQFAQAALGLVNPDLRVYVEYSNEVWNGGYAAAWYAQAQGLALGLSQNAFEAQIRFHARRSREIFGIWEQVFPKARLVRVLGPVHPQARHLSHFGSLHAA